MGKIDFSKVGFDTKAIHAGQAVDPSNGALATPIFQTSTFCFQTVEEGMAKFAKTMPGFVYSRSGNPTTRALELKLAALEGGEDAVATASGMGAVGGVVVGLIKAGDHIICDNTTYGGTSVVMRTNMPQFGVDVTFVDTSNLQEVENAFKPNTKMVYFESSSNPTMKVTDVKAVCDIAKKHGVKVVVDNTFSPPPIEFPLQLGADIVLHSLTKYINGHGDVLGGIVVGSKEDIALIRGNAVTKLCGAPPSPFNSYLVLRGIKTLALRVERHCSNALKMAQYLEKSPYVKKVYYPGLESSEYHEVAKKQMHGMYTGILSFELKDEVKGHTAFEACKKLLNSLTIADIAVSLGDPDTLIEHPASMTHANVPQAEREAAGIRDGLVRLSVGLENVDDLIADFENAFSKL